MFFTAKLKTSFLSLSFICFSAQVCQGCGASITYLYSFQIQKQNLPSRLHYEDINLQYQDHVKVGQCGEDFGTSS